MSQAWEPTLAANLRSQFNIAAAVSDSDIVRRSKAVEAKLAGSRSSDSRLKAYVAEFAPTKMVAY